MPYWHPLCSSIRCNNNTLFESITFAQSKSIERWCRRVTGLKGIPGISHVSRTARGKLLWRFFFAHNPGGKMHLAKQRLLDATQNPPSPPFIKGGNLISPFIKGGLRGILPGLITVAIVLILTL